MMYDDGDDGGDDDDNDGNDDVQDDIAAVMRRAMILFCFTYHLVLSPPYMCTV